MSVADPRRFTRLARALRAARRAEEGRLAIVNARVVNLRAEAGRLRHLVATAPEPGPGANAFDLLADSAWRSQQRERAIALGQEADTLAHTVAPIRQRLAQMLGKERALDRLASDARRTRAAAAEAREAEAASLLRAYSRGSSGPLSGTSSDGIA